MNPHRLRAYIYLSIVAVIWGIAGPVIKLTLKSLPPDIFLLYRFFLSSLIAVFYFLFAGFRLPKDPKIIRDIFIYCFLNTVTLGLLFAGTAITSLLDMSLISLFGPILLILAGFLFLKEHITSKERLGIIIAFFGSFLVILEPLLKNHNGTSGLLGNLLILFSLVASTIAGVLVKKLLRQNVSPVFLANLSFLVGFLTLLPVVLLSGHRSSLSSLVSIPFPYHLGVFYMAIFSGTIAYTLANLAQKTIELSEAALFTYIYPIFSAILAVVLLQEKLTLPAVIGSVITLSGVLLAEIKKKRYNSSL